ncbi:MAG TPA: histone deacetylase family protein [Rhizomicrobium sp.]|nr:histone deacetylase family protein [Rhizomicrobium sp.]
MAKTGLISHKTCLEHVPRPGHPENPARLAAVLKALSTPEFASLARFEAPRADLEPLLAAHTQEHVDAILDAFNNEKQRSDVIAIDADTFMSPGSAEAALHAAGAVIRAVDGVASGEFQNAFCAVRPPGHHAPRDRAMGFCLFNNVAIGAFHARKIRISERIAVIDFDVHHGNGTEEIFWNDANLLYASTHQMPLYPGTGYARERGVANNILNVPLAPASGSKEFRVAMSDKIFPALESFAPQFIFISAGFDAHESDPLAGLCLHEDDFKWATAEICKLAKTLCGGRVVSTLEGGYDLGALGRSAAAHVRALMEA